MSSSRRHFDPTEHSSERPQQAQQAAAGDGAYAAAPAADHLPLPFIPPPPMPTTAQTRHGGGTDALAAAATIREQRAALTCFGAGSPELRALPLADYTAQLVVLLQQAIQAIDALLDQLDAGQQPEPDFALLPDPIAVPAERTVPLLTNNAALRGTAERGSIGWLLALPRLEVAAVPDVERRRAMGAEHDLSDDSLGGLLNRLSGIFESTVNRLQSQNEKQEAGDERLGRLRAAVAALHADGTDLAVGVDEMLATALYTMNLAQLPGQSANHSLFAVANLLCRLARDPSLPRPCTAAGHEVTHAEILAMLRVYAPFIIRVDTFLCRLPQSRRTLFRGVRFDFDLALYSTGGAVAWGAMTSTSDSLTEAQKFAGGRTLVIIQAGSTAMIDFLSAYAQERESLLPSFTLFTSLGVTSPGLLRMLGQQGSIISLRELGDAPSADEVVAGMIEAKQVMRELSAKFLQTYVQARVSFTPPPLPRGVACLALLDELLVHSLSRTADFADSTVPHLALVGDGGTGKTTALLALHCFLARHTQLGGLERPVISVFVALPKLADVQNGALIDAQVFAELGATSAEHAAEIAQHAIIVVLLDSLDECAVRNRDAWRPLLDGAPFCREHCRCIVSTRSEFRDRVPADAELFCSGGACKTMYVLPLTDTDERDFVRRFCAAHGAEVDDVQRSLARLQLTDQERRLPVLLTMALEIALQDARLGAPRGVYAAEAPALAEPQAGGGAAAGGGAQAQQQQRRDRGLDLAWLPAPGTRAHIFERFLDARRTHLDETVPLAAHQNLIELLQDAALRMLDAGDWSAPVGSLRQLCLDAVPRSGLKHESPNDVLLRIFSHHVPCRVEAIHDDGSAFAFWHKSLAEYLCARALFLSPTAALAKLSASSFSRREPGVLRAFNDLCGADLQRRLLVSLGPLYAAVRSASPHKRSNALALLNASDLPLHSLDFSNVDIAECNLMGVNLSCLNLRGARITDSILRNARFDHSNVDGLTLRNNQYSSSTPVQHPHFVNGVASNHRSLIASACSDGVLRVFGAGDERPAEARGHAASIRGVCFSPDGNYIATAGADSCVKIWRVDPESGGSRGAAFPPREVWQLRSQDSMSLRPRAGSVAATEATELRGAHCVVWVADGGGTILAGIGAGDVRAWSVSSDFLEVAPTLATHAGGTALGSTATATGGGPHPPRFRSLYRSPQGAAVSDICVAPRVDAAAGGSGRGDGDGTDRSRRILIACGNAVKTLSFASAGESPYDFPETPLGSPVYAVAASPHATSAATTLFAAGTRLGRLAVFTSSSLDSSGAGAGGGGGSDSISEISHTQLDGPIHNLCFEPSQPQVLAVSVGFAVTLVNIQTLARLRSFAGSNDDVHGVCFLSTSSASSSSSSSSSSSTAPAAAPHRLLCTGSFDGTVRVFNMQQRATAFKNERGHSDFLRVADFGPFCRLVLTASNDRTVRVWNAGAAKQLHLVSFGAFAEQAQFLPDATGAVLLRNFRIEQGGVFIWRWGEQQQQHHHHREQRPPLMQLENSAGALGFCVHPGGRWVAGAFRKRIVIWDATSSDGRAFVTLPQPAGVAPHPDGLAFDPDSSSLLAISSFTPPPSIYHQHQNQQGNQRNNAGAARTQFQLKIWEWMSAEVVCELELPHDFCDGRATSHVAVSRSLTKVAGVNGRNVAVIDLFDEEIDNVVIAHSSVVWSVAFSSAETAAVIATGAEDGAVRLFNAESGARLAELVGHGWRPQNRGPILFLKFAVDDARLVSCGHDSALFSWNVAQICKKQSSIKNSSENNSNNNNSNDDDENFIVRKRILIPSNILLDKSACSVSFDQNGLLLLSSGGGGGRVASSFSCDVSASSPGFVELVAHHQQQQQSKICHIGGITAQLIQEAESDETFVEISFRQVVAAILARADRGDSFLKTRGRLAEDSDEYAKWYANQGA